MITSNFQLLTPSDGREIIVAPPLGRSDPTWLDHGRSRVFYKGFPSEITYSCGWPLFEPPSGGATIISRPSVGVRSWNFEVITLSHDVLNSRNGFLEFWFLGNSSGFSLFGVSCWGHLKCLDESLLGYGWATGLEAVPIGNTFDKIKCPSICSSTIY